MNPIVTMPAQTFMIRLRAALEASWDRQTAYGTVEQIGNPALGQCYPTSWVVQHYFPATEIIKGKVWTGEAEEIHFWNGLPIGYEWYHSDFSGSNFRQDRSSENLLRLIGKTSATATPLFSCPKCRDGVSGRSY